MRPAQHRKLARAFHKMQLQIFGKYRVADEIDDQPVACRRDHHRHDGKAIEPVGDIDRIAGADDDEHADK